MRPARNRVLRIGKVSKAAAVSVDTIRFYEKSGLLRRAGRSLGGFRLYTRADVESLRFIRRAQKLGFTIREIRELLHLREDRLGACKHVRTLLGARLRVVREKLRELRSMERDLAAALRRCQLRLSGACGRDAGRCPTLQRMDRPAPARRTR